MRFCVTIDGKFCEVEVDPSDRVETMKAAIAQKIGVSPAQQSLVLRGKQLEDGHTLSEYIMPLEKLIRKRPTRPRSCSAPVTEQTMY